MLCLIRGGALRGGREFAIPLMAFLTYMLKTYSPHTDISHVGGHLACDLLLQLYFNSYFKSMTIEILTTIDCLVLGYSMNILLYFN